MFELKILADKLSPPARDALERACTRCQEARRSEIDIEDWLLALLDDENSDVAKILRHLFIEKETIERELRKKKTGGGVPPHFSHNLIAVWERAAAYAPMGTPIRSGFIFWTVLDYNKHILDKLINYNNIQVVDIEAFRTIWKQICNHPLERYGSRAKIEDHTLFLSYRRGLSVAFAERIYDHLYAVFGEGKIFFDVDTIPPGEDFRRVIENQIRSCKVLLIVIGPDTINATDSAGSRRIDQPNDYIGIELKAALAHQVPVLPALIDNAQMPSPDELPIELRDFAFRQALRVRPSPDFRRDMERLIQYLEQYLKPI
jgi:hypothetical protein